MSATGRIEGRPTLEGDLEFDGEPTGRIGGHGAAAARAWVDRLAPYRAADNLRATGQLSVTAIAYAALWILMRVSLDYSYAATLLLSIPTAGFLLRLFVLQHDCGHRSFLTSAAANDALGVALGVLTLTPYHHWRRNHLLHHATSGDLDRRGHGDIRLLTAREYRQGSARQRFWYRVLRNPLCLFGVAPVFHFAVLQRFPYYTAWSWKRSAAAGSRDDARGWEQERRSVYLTNALVAATMLALGWLVGFSTLLAIQLPVAILAAAAGMWLFHVQHCFVGTYWARHAQWDYVAACLRGSSHYKLPAVLQWLTASIGLHHVHHLDSRIPNYRLQECLNEVPALQRVSPLTLRRSLGCAWLSLWDEEERRYIRFTDLARRDRD